MIVFEKKPFDTFRQLCEEEEAPVEDGVAWCQMVTAEGGLVRSTRAVKRFIQAARLGRIEMVHWPELREYFRPPWKPHVTAPLAAMIGASISEHPARSRRGYAHDLAAMSRSCRGPECPCGWVPFVCIIGEQARGLMTGMCPFLDPRDDRVVFATLREVTDFATDGPEDELDRLHGG
jgi:hypothetical protein